MPWPRGLPPSHFPGMEKHRGDPRPVNPQLNWNCCTSLEAAGTQWLAVSACGAGVGWCMCPLLDDDSCSLLLFFLLEDWM